MKSSEIRSKFLDFFEARGHRLSPSASLVPADPTMLLTGAGMVPFKPIFMGKSQVDYGRAASAQKCVRTTDIELIGLTRRHLSFFEMLGNFSFGDYYKTEAITWAWELLTQVFGLDPGLLWVSVFETDDEAAGIWENEVGIDPSMIVRLGENDNFWSAGPTGPCGPSSEILFDRGPENGCDKPTCAVGCDCDRFLEIWNLVFMQYNRDEDGQLNPLPKKNIDTGMGLERIASILQRVSSNFDIDLIKPIIDKVCSIASVQYGAGAKTDISLRIIADHARSVSFMIGDGILPGNDGRGYILRRLLRRAVRHGRLLGIETIFLPLLIDIVVDLMADPYPNLSQNRDFIKTIAVREEERFSNTLRQGLTILSEVVTGIKAGGAGEVPGETVFKLYDTYGFPFELTEEIALESELVVDKAGFDLLMAEQRERARAKAPGAHAELYISNLYHQIKEQIGPTEFVGYETEAADGRIVAISAGDQIKMEANVGEKVEIFLDKTPFYAEKGGQAGDAGQITTETGKVKIIDSKAPVADLVAHIGEVVEGGISLGPASAVVDDRRRRSISRNHTATHLLHWALRVVLGEHVKQAGSSVEADRLRFDFNHHEPLTADQLRGVEKLVNEKILLAQPVRAYETTFEYAKEAGALAFFGEKYGRFVRLVEVGSFSKELCGGVHVHSSSEIGYLKIISEAGIGANTRRLEAITGEQFLNYVGDIDERLNVLAEQLKTPRSQLVKGVASLVEAHEKQARELEHLLHDNLGREAEKIAGQVEQIKGATVFTGRLKDADLDGMRFIADKLRVKAENAAVVLVSAKDGKALVLVAATSALVRAGFNADSIIKKVAPIIQGGGGGRADFAQAGGKDAGKLADVLPEAKKAVADLLAAGQPDSGKIKGDAKLM